MQIPQLNPVFQREHSSNMYSVHAYYTAIMCQTFCVIWFYPIMVSVLSFYCFDFEYKEAEDLLTYMGGALFIALSGIYFGIFVGTLTND